MSMYQLMLLPANLHNCDKHFKVFCFLFLFSCVSGPLMGFKQDWLGIPRRCWYLAGLVEKSWFRRTITVSAARTQTQVYVDKF